MASAPLALTVRAAQSGDRDTIIEFNALLASETEGKTLDHSVLAVGVDAALADPERLRYWVAVAAGQVVAQAAVTREWSDWRNGWIWWFQSVYVRPDSRGRGVFRMIYEQIRREALAAHDVIGLRLYVDDTNTRAQQTYRSMGMKPGGYHVYEDLWTERFENAGR